MGYVDTTQHRPSISSLTYTHFTCTSDTAMSTWLLLPAGDLVATLSYVLLLCSRAADGAGPDGRPHFAPSGGACCVLPPLPRGGSDGGAAPSLPACAGRSSSSSVGCGAGGGLELQPDWLLTAVGPGRESGEGVAACEAVYQSLVSNQPMCACLVLQLLYT